MFWTLYAKPEALMPYYIAGELVSIEKGASISDVYYTGEVSRRGHEKTENVLFGQLCVVKCSEYYMTGMAKFPHGLKSLSLL